MMRAGKLRHRVRITEKVRTGEDKFGQSEFDEITFSRPYVEIQPLSGRELFQARELHPEVTHRVTMRHEEGIKSEMKLEHRGRIFEFLGPPLDVDERNIEISLLAKERTDNVG